MAESSTANLGWTKPDPGASANTWGTTLNGTTDKIDAAVFGLQQGSMPIGTIVMWAGATAPLNWLICDGSALVITAYQALYNVCQTAFNVPGVPAGSFNLPNLVQKFPLGAGPNPVGVSGGAFAVTLGTSNIPVHSHTVTDPQHHHSITDQMHTHTVNQWSHNHGDSGHSHDPSGSYQDQHRHGGVMTQAAGYFSLSAQNPQITSGFTDYQTPALHISIGTGYANIDSRTSAISLNNSGAGLGNTQSASTGISSTGNAGSSAPFNVVPPFQAVNYIIRYA